MKVNISIMQEDIMMNGIVKDVLQDEILCEMLSNRMLYVLLYLQEL